MPGSDGVDFRLLITEIDGVGATSIPTNIIFQSELMTIGSVISNSGVQKVFTDGYLDIELGGVDLVDGATYAWILDAVVSADGVEGYMDIRANSSSGPDYTDGNFILMNYDLEDNVPNQGGWDNVMQYDLAFRLLFEEGGVPLPENDVIDTFDYGLASPLPVPAAVWLFGTALIGLVGFSKRRKAA